MNCASVLHRDKPGLNQFTGAMNANFGLKQLSFETSAQSLTKHYELGEMIFKTVHFSDTWLLLVNKIGIKIYAHRNVPRIKIFNQHLASAYHTTSGGSVKDGGADTDDDNKDDGGDTVIVTG